MNKLKKMNKYTILFLSEIFNISAGRLQKPVKEGISDAHSKTLIALEKSHSDLAAKNINIDWLDVGCGNGRCLDILDTTANNKNVRYIGIDPTYEFYSATERAKKYGVNFEFETLPAENIIYEKKFDLISAILLLHEIDPRNLPLVLVNLMRALKDEGILVISDFQEPFELEKDIIYWTSDEIEFVLKNIFINANADFSVIPSSENPREFSFYAGIIKKSEINYRGFKDFTDNYEDFLNYKQYKMRIYKTLLKTQVRTGMMKISDTFTGNTLEESELERLLSNIELDCIIKGYKAALLTRYIDCISKINKDFLKSKISYIRDNSK